MANKLELTWYGKDEPIRVEPRLLIENAALSNTASDPDTQNMLIHGDNLLALKALESKYAGQVKCIYIVILTPILMSILSSENAQRFNQSKTYFTLDLLIGWHSTLLRVSRP